MALKYKRQQNLAHKQLRYRQVERYVHVERENVMILETNRLEFRVIQKEDIQVLHQNIFTDTNVMKFAFSKKHNKTVRL